MRTKRGANICLYFEQDGVACKHYGGDMEKLESCKYNCKKLKKRKSNRSKVDKYIIGFTD